MKMPLITYHPSPIIEISIFNDCLWPKTTRFLRLLGRENVRMRKGWWLRRRKYPPFFQITTLAYGSVLMLFFISQFLPSLYCAVCIGVLSFSWVWITKDRISSLPWITGSYALLILQGDHPQLINSKQS